MWSNLKAIVKEHVSSENVPTFWWSMVMMKCPTFITTTINKQTSLNKLSCKLKLFNK